MRETAYLRDSDVLLLEGLVYRQGERLDGEDLVVDGLSPPRA